MGGGGGAVVPPYHYNTYSITVVFLFFEITELMAYVHNMQETGLLFKTDLYNCHDTLKSGISMRQASNQRIAVFYLFTEKPNTFRSTVTQVSNQNKKV